MAVDKNFEYNGRTYTFGIIPALEAIDVEVNVMKVLGEPLFQALTGKNEGVDEEAFGAAALGLLLKNMEKNTLKETLATVFQYTSVNGPDVPNGGSPRIDINTHFTGRNKDVWVVFVQALRFNFADFLPEGLLTSIKSKLPK